MTLSVDWWSSDPAGLAAWLAEDLGIEGPTLDALPAIPLVGGAVSFRRSRAGEADRLSVTHSAAGGAASAGQGPEPDPAGRPDGAARAEGPPGPRLLAVGWATVDVGRAAAEVAGRFGLAAGAFEPATDDAWLGGRAWTARLGPTRLVLLEPSTEGRLTAALARAGEGPCALYLAAPTARIGAARPGPLGPVSLVRSDRPWGPFVLVRASGPPGWRGRHGTIAG